MKVYVLDDEVSSINNICSLISTYTPNLKIVGSNVDANKAYSEICATKPDLLILDILLFNETGFDFLERFKHKQFEVIIITAYDNFALQAYKNHVLSYLQKPIDPLELIDAIARAKSIVQSKIPVSNNDNIFVSNKSEKTLIKFSDIVYLESDGSYTHFELKNGKSLMSSKIIKEYEQILPVDQFFRVHNKYIVNKNHIVSYQSGRGGTIVMINNQRLEVSARKKPSFLQFYKV